MTILAPQQRPPPITRDRIAQLAGEISRAFSPSRVILFGSHASGTAGPDSDVDLLVLFPTKPPRGMSLRIRRRIQRGFALDVIAMDEARFARRLALGDFFLREIQESGKVLYESAHP
jgi:predicted nucleotidyltransferase